MCPVQTLGVLACPARFERATYGLEGTKIYVEKGLVPELVH